MVASAVAAGGRRRARRHLDQALPELPVPERRRIFRAFIRHTGELLGEVGWLWNAPRAEILDHTEFSGLENLTGGSGGGGGTVLVTGHCGNWEWLNLGITAAGISMAVAVREIFDARIDAIVQRLRGRFGTESAQRGRRAGQQLAAALRAGKVIGLLIDQDIDAPGAFVEFFGRPAWTPTGAAFLAARVGRPVVMGFASRTPAGAMRLHFDEPIEIPGGFTPEEVSEALTAVLTARIESEIRLHPDQWVWSHRRWRRAPAADEKVWRAADYHRLLERNG